ncbi:hypothetical protein [Actinotignum urinale]|uniref:XRE family transcriptional regulator n=1 Tax=Actinotignum urinale TaxID=190146 RepID=A0AAW9HTA9_9ACTO|nr:hypothetical protein [Actinotignum urinale]MDY5154313.1 hypothetical protein [Actinotignum urinale]
MDTRKWLEKITRTSPISINAIATKSGLTQSVLNDRAKKNSLTADQVIAIAKAYGYNPVRALILFEHLEESDFWIPNITNTLRDATDAEIVEEVARRIALGSTEEFDKPIDAVSSYVDETQARLKAFNEGNYEIAAKTHQ